jgi:hypothetical protein
LSESWGKPVDGPRAAQREQQLRLGRVIVDQNAVGIRFFLKRQLQDGRNSQNETSRARDRSCNALTVSQVTEGNADTLNIRLGTPDYVSSLN